MGVTERFYNSKNLEAASKSLGDFPSIAAMVAGNTTLAVAANDALLVLKGGEVIHAFEYSELTDVSVDRKALGFRSVAISASDRSATVSMIEKKEPALAFVATVSRLRHSTRGEIESSPRPTPATGPVEQIAHLAELREAGVVSEDEFEQAKRSLLASL